MRIRPTDRGLGRLAGLTALTIAFLAGGAYSADARPAPRSAPPDCRVSKCVALTFDDGPGPYTDRLLHILARNRVRATFFSVGEMVAARPGVEASIAAAGHEIGNHSWSHPNFRRLTNSAIRRELDRTAAEIEKVTGARPTLVRPPYGALTGRVRRVISAEDSRIVLWSVDPLDWRDRNPRIIRQRVARHVRPGSIVLLHDIHPTTVAAVPDVIADLRRRHFTFVTVSELFAGSSQAGEVEVGREAEFQSGREVETAPAADAPPPEAPPDPSGGLPGGPPAGGPSPEPTPPVPDERTRFHRAGEVGQNTPQGYRAPSGN